MSGSNLTCISCSWASLPEAVYWYFVPILSPVTDNLLVCKSLSSHQYGVKRMSDNSDLGRFGPWSIRTFSVDNSDLGELRPFGRFGPPPLANSDRDHWSIRKMFAQLGPQIYEFRHWSIRTFTPFRHWSIRALNPYGLWSIRT